MAFVEPNAVLPNVGAPFVIELLPNVNVVFGWVVPLDGALTPIAEFELAALLPDEKGNFDAFESEVIAEGPCALPLAVEGAPNGKVGVDDDAADVDDGLEGAVNDEGCPNTGAPSAGLEAFPNSEVPEPDAVLPPAVPKLNMDLAGGGGPAGVVVAVFSNAEPVGGVPAGVVLMRSTKADPLTGVDGAGLALPNSGLLGVPAGVVLVPPNADPLAGVFGKAKVDVGFASGVAGASLGTADMAPNADEPLVFPKNPEVPEGPLFVAVGRAPKPNVFGAVVAEFDVAAGVVALPKLNKVAGFDASVAVAGSEPDVVAVGAVAGFEVTPKLNLTGALDSDDAAGIKDDEGAAG